RSCPPMHRNRRRPTVPACLRSSVSPALSFVVTVPEMETVDEVVEVRSRDIELARGLEDVPVVPLERVAHEAPLELLHRVLELLPLGADLARRRREHVLLAQHRRLRAVRADHRGLDRVRELPRVT